ncbi:glycosyltransferase family 4 protein [Natronoglycomyces albus]|uniref:Glycosyltransferase family 4 protein n=1 Tax=Natronoglycomyces albus TaxID=2811108 RepID=A0A895XFT0_9ACTN|nr:glycosyltransferase family 4 protein [Natronoglycomyces albus]QSB04184.1 glycosyltransferase family 4 protein [Natronoglycomyces albus]
MMKVGFLVHNAYGNGGTVRTTVNTANFLAERGHEVEIASVHRHRDDVAYRWDERVKLSPLTDSRPLFSSKWGTMWRRGNHLRQRRLAQVESDIFPRDAPGHDLYSRLSDERVRQWLATTEASVIISTKAGLHSYLAAYGRPETILIGQEHRFLNSYRGRLRSQLLKTMRGLDAIVTLTQEDCQEYRRELADFAAPIRAIPNAVPVPVRRMSKLSEPVIMAAGRHTRTKGFDLLVDAFGMLAEDFPEWSLVIYGSGSESSKLDERISREDLRGRVVLAGEVTPLDDRWAQASIAVVPSRFEGFGMSLIEAMASGVPVVATDVPIGPRVLIEHHRNGMLCEPTASGIAKQLEQLMADAQLRYDLSEAELRTAEGYRPQQIAPMYEDLFGELVQRRRHSFKM